MPQTSPRTLRLSDVLILVAATAFGLAGCRFLLIHFETDLSKGMGRLPLGGNDPLGLRRAMAPRQGRSPSGLATAVGLVGCGPRIAAPRATTPATTPLVPAGIPGLPRGPARPRLEAPRLCGRRHRRTGGGREPKRSGRCGGPGD